MTMSATRRKKKEIISPEMIEAFSVCGTPDMCIERITQLLKSGISQFVVGSPIGSNVRKAIDLISAKIIPHFEENIF